MIDTKRTLAGEFLFSALLVVHRESMPGGFDGCSHYEEWAVQASLVGEAQILVVTHLDCARPLGRVGDTKDKHQKLDHLRKFIL
jgi:hypothetical protein